MTSARLAAFGLATASAAAMLYVGLYQVRAVKRLVCPLFGGCEKVADAPFARPFGVPDGFVALLLYGVILVLLALSPPRTSWLTPALLALGVLAAVGNALGVWDMIRLGSFCFYCVLTTALSPLLLWAIWASR
jgi:uncharacterized membrane protein